MFTCLHGLQQVLEYSLHSFHCRIRIRTTSFVMKTTTTTRWLFWVLFVLPALCCGQDTADTCTSAPPAGPVTINTFGACASAEMETRLKALEDMVTSLRNRGNDAAGNVSRLRGKETSASLWGKHIQCKDHTTVFCSNFWQMQKFCITTDETVFTCTRNSHACQSQSHLILAGMAKLNKIWSDQST